MIDFYVDKIVNGIINSKTGSVWIVNDVPSLWKIKVQKILKAQS